MTSLIDSVLANDLAGLQVGLSKGANPNAFDRDGRTALIHAAIDNRLDAAGLLLERGSNVNVQDKLGYTALHYAAQNYHPEMALLLLERGAAVDVQDVHGNTPLWRAVFLSHGRGAVIDILLKAGADRNRKNERGRSPLELATTIANYSVAQFFE
jgi:ankyrin repeat protein